MLPIIAILAFVAASVDAFIPVARRQIPVIPVLPVTTSTPPIPASTVTASLPGPPTPVPSQPCSPPDAVAIQDQVDSFISFIAVPDGCGNGFTGNVDGASKNLAAMWLRDLFHDAGSFSKSDDSGGLDGSIANEIDAAEAAGLAASLVVQLDPSGTEYRFPFSPNSAPPPGPDMQPADLIAIAATTAIKHCGGPSFDISLGRLTAKPGERNDVSKIPADPFAPLNEVLAIFSRMGFSPDEAFVLVTGSHTLGGAHGALNPRVTNQTFVAFDRTPQLFDNDIFILLQDGINRDPVSCGGAAVLPIDCELAKANPFLNDIWAISQNSFFSAYSSAMNKLLNTLNKNTGPKLTGACPFNAFLHNFKNDTVPLPTPTPTFTTTTSFRTPTPTPTHATFTEFILEPVFLTVTQTEIVEANSTRTVFPSVSVSLISTSVPAFTSTSVVQSTTVPHFRFGL